MQRAAASANVELIELSFGAESEIANLIRSLKDGRSALFVAPDFSTQTFRSTIIGTAEELRLPTMYAIDLFVRDGGLISYGASFEEMWRLAGRYVGRVLSGDRPADLPVQAPNKFELSVNLRTANTQRISNAPELLAIAAMVIE